MLSAWTERARALAVPLGEAIDPAWGVSPSTLWGWKRAFDAKGLVGLLPSWRGPASSIPQRCWDIFRGIYLDQNRPSATDAYERMLTIYTRETEGDVTGVPDVSAFRRRLSEIPEAAILLYREGQKAYYDRAEPFLTRSYDCIPAGDQFIADHHPLDFAGRMADGRAGRFWVTAWIDRRSGKLIGRALCERPSTDSVLASFAAAVSAHGCPLEAWMDQGKDFGSKAFAGTTKCERRQARRIRETFGKGVLDESRVRPLMVELGVEPHFSLPYNARAKAIERTFGVLARTFSKGWPSYLGHNTLVKPESAARAWNNPSSLPDYEQVLAELDKWIVAINAREHKSGRLRGLSSDDAWEKFRGDVRPVRADLLPILALRQENPQLVKRNGVCLFGRLWYWNQQLTLHLGREVVVRYNPGDLSRVWIFDIEGKLLVEVERSELANVSRQDVGAAMAAQRRARRAVRTQFAPPPVIWKTQTAAAAAPSAAVPSARAGRSEFDMNDLDGELIEGLDKTG
jgi:transposase InsO family protein